MPSKKVIQTVITLIALILIILFVKNINKITSLFTRAHGQAANLVVNVGNSFSGDNDVWQNLAQGGEESNSRMIADVINQTAALKPQYIRLDHIYDFYNVVQKENGQITFHWQALDLAVNDILATGAKPFLSLSYMPASISSGSDVDLPSNWSDWEFVVQKTIEHFSRDRSLENVYYEVWNEPDLFGQFKTYGQKNYLNLYYHSALGASRTQATKPYFLGGPATTALYQNWVTALLEFTKQNNLKLDFISWHTYNTDLFRFEKDLDSLLKWLINYPEYQNIELIISELGPDSANNPIYDNSLGAIHALALTAFLQTKIDRAFTFEIKDGPGSEKYWGRWGLLTHQKFGPPEPKPRYFALNYLNQMAGGQRVNVAGEGSWVKTFAKAYGQTIKLFVVNYDPAGKHSEAVPLNFINLPGQKFTYERTNYPNQPSRKLDIFAEGPNWQTVEYFEPNSAAIITLTFEE